MLNELQDMQEGSDEAVWTKSVSVEVETRSQDGDELVHKTYTFSHAEEWDKWTFSEYGEKRTPDTTMMKDRNWRQTEHIFWHEVSETPTIDVPPEVADALAEATGADGVTLQVPAGSLDENRYKEVHHSDQ